MSVIHPSKAVVIKLGSIARHAQEMIGPSGHPVDVQAIRALLSDPEVAEWMEQADAMALLPVMR